MSSHPELYNRGSKGSRSQDRLWNCLPEITAQRSAIRHSDTLPHLLQTLRNNVGVPSEGAEPPGTAEEMGASAGNQTPFPGCYATAFQADDIPMVASAYVTVACDYHRPPRNPLRTQQGGRKFNDPKTPHVREKDSTCGSSNIPTISDLLHLAVTETDFTGDLTDDQRLLEINVENSIDLASDIWSDRNNGATVPLSLIQWARCALLLEAEAMLADREAHAEAELADDIEAGNRDRDGNVIPWERYP